MSEPKRYNEEMVDISDGDPCGEIECDYAASMVEAFEGRWVSYDDYARLKAEVERLTKAGDFMYDRLCWLDNSDNAINARLKWREAKEVQS